MAFRDIYRRQVALLVRILPPTVDDPNPWRLVKAIQELKSDNDDLRTIIAREEAEIADLRREGRAR